MLPRDQSILENCTIHNYNIVLLAAHATGASVRVIARAAGISYARVFQIIREER